MKTMREMYQTEIPAALTAEFKYKNPMELPCLNKIVVNVGAGRAKEVSGLMPEVEKTLRTITGQKPVVTKAKRALAAFKIRAGQPVGAKVTLRGKRMFDFLERLISVTLPRIRDFRGLALSTVDEHGNFNLGLRDQTIFPEIAYEDTGLIHGLEVSVVTTAKSKAEALSMFKLLGFPFKKEEI